MLFWLTFIQSLPSLSSINAVKPSLSQSANKSENNLQESVEGAIAPKSISEFSAINLSTTQASVGQIPVGQISGGLIVFPAIIVVIIVLLIMSVWAYTRVYVITPNNEAFVRTGGVFAKQKKVILYGGCVVLPGFHELTRVPLREISIDVERTGNLAVRTQDYLRADMRVTFYVCINGVEQDVLTAAARLSQNGKITAVDIKDALEKRADDAIRAAAKTKNLAEIDSDKLGFAQEVLNLVQQDLGKVGLTLNNIAISEVQESNTYDENNFFDAQGVRLRTETIQRSIQQKREVELTTRVAIEQKELDAEKRSLQISQEKEGARLGQQLEVEAMKAQREREIQEAKARESSTAQQTQILQEKAVEEAEIQRKLSIQQSQIEAQIEIEEQNKKLRVAQTLQQQESELAEITRKKNIDAQTFEAQIEVEEQNKKFKVAQALQQQDAELAEINRKKTVDSQSLEAQVQVAESERLARIAQEDVAIAIAQKRQESFMAEAARAQAEARVQTATDVEVAERSKQLAVIVAEQKAQEQRISDQNVVEIDVFRRRRQAEIAKDAAELEAEAIRTLAAAEKDKALAEADGIRAKLEAKNIISSANLTADVLQTIWPDLAERLPEVLRSLAPQPGVLGDARVYSFPGANGNGSSADDINKLLLSTSGLALINSLLEDGKLGKVVGKVGQLLQNKEPDTSVVPPEEKPES
ncbi:MAG: SPFH domain-containing protein [Leptolyngbyaceae bacterium]|nr:SPFH domain-containing protein [Leptolyngbyaceae bacterium]